ncbi:MAG: hypothetical protein NE328_19795 [Lentisphaeraceae bacterium]|nr:hypothetical protein [Lentisphaeraceae bacterium]
MKNLLKKTIAILFLAIYAVNPLHAILHASHDHSHHNECSVSECDEKVEYKTASFHIDDSHECFLCQNQQDKTHSFLADSDAKIKQSFSSQLFSNFANIKVLNKGLFFVDSRGPPSLI